MTIKDFLSISHPVFCGYLCCFSAQQEAGFVLRQNEILWEFPKARCTEQDYDKTRLEESTLKLEAEDIS
jgi:hypothetical protein